MDDAQKLQFQQRLDRIAKGGPNTIGQVYVGPAEMPDSKKKKKSAGPDILDNLFIPISMIGAFLVGALAVFVTRFVRFHMMGGDLTGDNADLWMIVDSVIAVGIVITLRSLFRFGGKALETAKTVGIVAMILTMHNFVHLAPGTFSKVFSPEWTDQVIATTEPKSILFRGISFVVGDMPEEAPQLPQRIELANPDVPADLPSAAGAAQN